MSVFIFSLCCWLLITLCICIFVHLFLSEGSLVNFWTWSQICPPESFSSPCHEVTCRGGCLSAVSLSLLCCQSNEAQLPVQCISCQLLKMEVEKKNSFCDMRSIWTMNLCGTSKYGNFQCFALWFRIRCFMKNWTNQALLKMPPKGCFSCKKTKEQGYGSQGYRLKAQFTQTIH